MIRRLIFFFTALSLVFFLPLYQIHAQPTEAPTSTTSVTIDYKLPHPGMLPDNPLYKLKVVRDKIMLMLIGDPDEKTAYYLLLANKQLLMSKLLVDKGNIPLAKETALKGENQMTLMTFVYKNSNRVPQPNFLKEVKTATLKHQELLKGIISKLTLNDAKIFSDVLEFSQRNINELQNLTVETN